MSEISSSPRKTRRGLSCDSLVGGAVADAPPVIAKETPARASQCQGLLSHVPFGTSFRLRHGGASSVTIVCNHSRAHPVWTRRARLTSRKIRAVRVRNTTELSDVGGLRV